MKVTEFTKNQLKLAFGRDESPKERIKFFIFSRKYAMERLVFFASPLDGCSYFAGSYETLKEELDEAQARDLCQAIYHSVYAEETTMFDFSFYTG